MKAWPHRRECRCHDTAKKGICCTDEAGTTSAIWRLCRASTDMGSKDDSHHWFRLERSWVEPGTSEANMPSMVAIRLKSSADYKRWLQTVRHCEASAPHAHPESQTPNLPVPNRTDLVAYAASPGELNRIDKKVCRYLRALSTGTANDLAATESHGRSLTNAQFFHKWKVLPARAEIAIRRVKRRQAMTEHSHAHLQTLAAIWDSSQTGNTRLRQKAS